MSQCSRVLEVLRDGLPHSIEEIHERAGTMRLNSRVADLRRMGYLVVYYRKDGLHTYQLVDGTVREPATPADGLAAAQSQVLGLSPESARPTDTGASAAADPGFSPVDTGQGRQLSVWEAA